MTETIDALRLNLGNDGLMVMNVSLAVIMFGVALELTIQDFKDIAKNPKATFLGSASQFILLPLLTFVLVWIMEPAPSIALGMMMVAACPGGNISNFFSLLARGNAALSVSMTAIATLFAIILTPLNFTLWASLYPPTQAILQEISLDLAKVFEIIVLILGVPLVLGMIVRHTKPVIAEKLSPWIKGFGVVFFAGFVIVAFMMNFDSFIQYVEFVFLIVMIHNAVALGSGYGIAALAGLPYADRKSISIETGIQNSGLGLLLIFNFFDGLGGMALITAWWGIWHILAGLTLGWYWSVGKKSIQRVLTNA
ncbi:bile acid:sodium symporter family protein [Balneola vulgaris]|uniref:bile acid:sodium symporter family protein n=1 Tax=Balneola vulgaris TaxID=287535 RepID=UPI00036E3403|nr:bile acid:sodium symporter family protein [Balneola vulgaris]